MWMLSCSQCLREGRVPPTYGTDMMRPNADRARPAITVTGGEALCGFHLPDDFDA